MQDTMIAVQNSTTAQGFGFFIFLSHRYSLCTPLSLRSPTHLYTIHIFLEEENAHEEAGLWSRDGHLAS